MRLINTTTLELEEFCEPDVPKYTILSHRWTKDELTYKDFVKRRREGSIGHKKALDFCKVALERGHQYGWLDSVCIDKRSSAELSEAINSMWTWYQKAEECVVHLADVDFDMSSCVDGKLVEDQLKALRASDWFNRGWTLQELIAPERALFFNKDWRIFGRRAASPHMADESLIDLSEEISNITTIPTELLASKWPIKEYTIGVRAKWLARRQVTRVEDHAYCALGLFGVNMPLLYGEGSNAWIRLQEEVIRTTHDESSFAWPSSPLPGPCIQPLLSSTPLCFANLSSDTATVYEPRPLYSITNQGLRWDLQPGSAMITHVKFDAPRQLDTPGRMDIPMNALLVPLACLSEAQTPRQDYVLLVELICGHYMRVVGYDLSIILPTLVNLLRSRDKQSCVLDHRLSIYVHMRANQSKGCTFAYNQLPDHQTLALAVTSQFQQIDRYDMQNCRQEFEAELSRNQDEMSFADQTSQGVPGIQALGEPELLDHNVGSLRVTGKPHLPPYRGRPADLERARRHNMQMQLYDCPDPECLRKGSYGFGRKDKLRMHMRNKHGDTTYLAASIELAGLGSERQFGNGPEASGQRRPLVLQTRSDAHSTSPTCSDLFSSINRLHYSQAEHSSPTWK